MSLSRRAATVLRHRASHFRSFTTSTRSLASQDYGSGEGDPKGSKPFEQGPNPSEHKEHPGPPPPKPGQGSRGGPTAAGEKSQNSTSGGDTQQKRKYTTASSASRPQPRWVSQSQTRTLATTPARRAAGVQKPKGDTKHAEPKLKVEDPPTDENAPEEVKEHNEDLSRRADKPTASVSNDDAQKDKVKPSFWKGHGGQGEGMDKEQ